MKQKLATVPEVKEPKSKKGQWYLYFLVRNPLTGKMKPQKIYEGFSKQKTIEEKRIWGDSLKNQYIEKLKLGWSPFDDKEKYIYNNQLEYNEFSKRFGATKSSVKNTRFFLNQYLSIKEKSLKPKTSATYTSKLRIFCNWLDKNGYTDYDISEINNKIILEFFDFLIVERKLDRITIDKYGQMIKDYFNYLIKIKKITINPVFDIIRPPKLKDMAARPINDYDLKIILLSIKASDPQLYLACLFQYYLGLRPGQELRLLKIKDIDLYNNRVVVTDANAKIERRTIDMCQDLVQLCFDYNIHHYDREFYVFGRKGIPGIETYGQNTLRNKFNHFRDQLGMPKIYKFYSMKHTGGGKFLASGRTLEELRSHFGHKNIESTDHYVRRHFGNRNQNIINNFPKPY